MLRNEEINRDVEFDNLNAPITKEEFDIEKNIYNDINSRKVEYDYNSDMYRERFIEYFLKVFPNIYTKEELDIIIKNNVKKVEYNPQNGSKRGEYFYYKKLLELYTLQDRVLFHEFIHALTDDEISFGYEELRGMSEAFTAYADRIFTCCSYSNFEKNYNDNKYVYPQKRQQKVEYMISYQTLAIFAQQLELLNFMADEKESLLTTFLKRENIYLKIKDIYTKYYNIVNSDITEQQIEKEIYDLILNMNNLLEIIKKDSFEADCIFNIPDEEKPQVEHYYTDEQLEFIDKTIAIIDTIEDKFFEMYRVFLLEKGYDKVSQFNMISILKYIPSREDRLMHAIFGETNDDEMVINNIRQFTKKYRDNEKNR